MASTLFKFSSVGQLFQPYNFEYPIPVPFPALSRSYIYVQEILYTAAFRGFFY